MNFILSAIVLMGLLSSCKIKPINRADSSQVIQNFNSYGDVHRSKWPVNYELPFPLNRMGTLMHPIGSRCSAFYIGKKFILTAAHCVMVDGGENLKKGNYLYEHRPSRDWSSYSIHRIQRFFFVELKRITKLSRAKNHWVILELDRDIEQPSKAFKTVFSQDSDFDENHEANFNLSIAGFSPIFNGNTNELTFSLNDCSLNEHYYDSEVVLHNCDAGRRDSGSPLYKCQGEFANWSDCQVSAIHLGSYGGYTHRESYDSRFANIAVSAKSFGPAVEYLINDGPKPANLKIVTNQ